MKTRTYLAPSAAALAAFLGLSISQDAQAVAFQNLPQLPSGVTYVWKLSNFEEGSLYATQPLNGEIGATNNPALGVGLMDAQQVSAPVGARNTGAIPGAGGSLAEDSWGIAVIQQIFRSDNLVTPVWNAAADNQQLTTLFYGTQDFYGKQVSLGLNPGPQDDSMTIASRGLQIDVYLSDTTLGSHTSFTPGNPALAANRPADDAYLTVTDSNFGLNSGTATTARPVLTMRSDSGFLRGTGDFGGLATEFETTSIGTSLNLAGSGAAFLSVAPTLGGTGSLNSLWDTNGFLSPHVAGKRADFSLQFTATVDGSGDWLLSSQDPFRGSVIPEPTTALIGLGCMLPMLTGAFGRRRKSTGVVNSIA